MNLLLDSHVLIWALERPASIPNDIQNHLTDRSHNLYVSAATLWEIAIKASTPKLNLSLDFDDWMKHAESELEISHLPIRRSHISFVNSLPYHHRDPFDRMIVSQSIVENLTLVSNDATLDAYGMVRLW